MSFRMEKKQPQSRKALDAKGLATAYHESGHAVAAWSLGYDVESVSIVRDGRSMGRLSYDNPSFRIRPDEWPRHGFAEEPGDQNEAMDEIDSGSYHDRAGRPWLKGGTIRDLTGVPAPASTIG
jgi:hypothetical protein